MLKSIFYILLPLSFLSCKTLPQSALVDSSIEVKRLSGHKSEIGFAKLLPGSGRSLVTGGLNGQVFVWDLEAGRKSWGLTFTGSVYDALPSPGGESVFIAASKGLIQRLDARTGASLKKWLHPERGAAIKLAMTSDGRTLAVAYLNGELVYMDTQTGAESKPFKGVFDWPVVRAMDFSKDGRRLFIADPGSATEVDVLTGTILRRVRDLRYCQASKCIPWLTAAAISSDRRLVAVGSLNAVRVYNMENGLEVFTLGEHIGEVSHLEFRNGHQQLISQSLDGGSMAWGIPSGKLMIMHNNERPNIWNTGLDEMSTHLIGFDRDNFDIVLSRVKNIAATYSSTNDKDLFGQATISGVNDVALRVGNDLIDSVGTKKGRCIGQVVSLGDPNFRKFSCPDVFKAELTYDDVSLLGRLVLKIPATSGREIYTQELLCVKSELATSYASRIINCRPKDVF